MVDVSEVPQLINGTGVLGWAGMVALMAKQIWRANQESTQQNQQNMAELFEQAKAHAANIAESHGKIAAAQQTAIELLTASTNRAHEAIAWSQGQERDCQAKYDQLAADMAEMKATHVKEIAALKRQLATTTSQTAATTAQVAAMAEKVPA